jgi:hypothetical protein
MGLRYQRTTLVGLVVAHLPSILGQMTGSCRALSVIEPGRATSETSLCITSVAALPFRFESEFTLQA